MAVIQQSRQTEQPATQASSAATGSLPSAGASLWIRLWRAHEAAQPGDLPWKSSDPAVCLTLAPNGRFLVAGFTGIQPAILTARRLQWAMLGFAEGDRFAGTAAAILVHSGFDPAALEGDAPVLQPLENAAGGQILLTSKTAELLQDLPGLPLQAGTDAGVCELLWRSAEETSGRSADEDALSAFIKLHGLEVEAPPQPVAPAVVAVPPARGATDRGVRAVPDAVATQAAKAFAAEINGVDEAEDPGSGGFDFGVLASRLWAKPRILVGAACAVAILLVIVTVAISHKGAAKPASVAVQPVSSAAAVPANPAQTPQSQPAAAAPVATSPAIATEAVKPSESTQKGRKREEPGQASPAAADAAKSQANQPKIAGGNCDLDSNLLPKMLEQAEKSREEGNYPAALRQFRAVLACDRNNARARSGLDLTEFGMQHR
jgi:hypothetical protein